MVKKFKIISPAGNIIFYTWNRAGNPEDARDVQKYGKHLSTWVAKSHEWSPIKISYPEHFNQLR